eukprot:2862844-Amphidinium_carterae.1
MENDNPPENYRDVPGKSSQNAQNTIKNFPRRLLRCMDVFAGKRIAENVHRKPNDIIVTVLRNTARPPAV